MKFTIPYRCVTLLWRYVRTDNPVCLPTISPFFFLFWKGFHGDLNETYPVGEINEESKGLIRTTRESLDAAIKLCRPGALFRDIGKAMSVISLPLSSLETYTFCYYKVNRLHERMDVRLYVHTQVMGSTIFSMVPQTYHIMLKTKPSEQWNPEWLAWCNTTIR